MTRTRWGPWKLWLVILSGLLGLTACGARCPRRSPYRIAAEWLTARGIELAGEPRVEVLVPRRAEACLTSGTLMPVATPAEPPALLAALDEHRPLYVLAGDDLVWEAVRNHRWFIDRYRPVERWSHVYPEPVTLTAYTYAPSPFDLGDLRAAPAVFRTEDVVLRSYRLSSSRVEPTVPLYLTLGWDDLPGGDYGQLTVHLTLVQDSTGERWYDTHDVLDPAGLYWQPEFRLARQHVIVPPDDLPEGSYSLRVGLRERSGRPLLVEGVAAADVTDPLLAGLSHPPDVGSVPVPMDRAVDYVFGGGDHPIRLAGYDAHPWARAGGEVRLALQWSAEVSVPESYHVFVHLVGPDGSLVTQSDGVPVYGFHPTTGWAPGDFIRDVHTLELSDALPVGEYGLIVGLYDPNTGIRLPVRDAQGTPLPMDQARIHNLWVYR